MTYVRNPGVKAWVLQAAMATARAAPLRAFQGSGWPARPGSPHVMPLSSYGSDTTANAVALCPNCHRRCHYSADRDEFKLTLYERIVRLAVEAPTFDEPVSP